MNVSNEPQESSLVSENQSQNPPKTVSENKDSLQKTHKCVIVGFIIFWAVALVLVAVLISPNKTQLQKLRDKRLRSFEDVGKVIQLPRKGSKYRSFPTDLPLTDENGKTIDQILYDQKERQERVKFVKQRNKYIDKNIKTTRFLGFGKWNLIVDEQTAKQTEKEKIEQWQRLDAKYNLSSVHTEAPFCIVIPSYNNDASFRIEHNLNSVLAQNYTNFKVVLIDDASNDSSRWRYRRYLEFANIDPNRMIYIQNQRRVRAMHNIYMASVKHCGIDDSVMLVDGDDELIGRNVLKVFNWARQTHNPGVAYSNYVTMGLKIFVFKGQTAAYTEEEIANSLYRNVSMKYMKVEVYLNSLFLQIEPEDLMESPGVFYSITYDWAMFYPMLELSCGRVTFIEDEVQYFYNMGTGLNDHSINGKKQIEVGKQIVAKKRYPCSKYFKPVVPQSQLQTNQ